MSFARLRHTIYGMSGLIDPIKNRVKPGQRLRIKVGKGFAVDYVGHFRREVAAFEARSVRQ